MPNTPFRIDRAVLRRVKVPMREPFRISNGSVSDKESIVIELHSGNDVGYGEASPMSGSFYSIETPETTWHALENDLVTDILHRTIESPYSYAEMLDDYGTEPFARAGIEGAAWDITAVKFRTTIRELFGALQRKIPSGLAVGIYDTIDELVERTAHFLESGYRRLKIKIMPGWDLEPIEAVRKRFPSIPLMVDANAVYNYADHSELLRSLDRFGLMMIEQPLAATALEEMAELSKMMKTPICVDESADSMSTLEEIIRLKSAAIVNIKVQRVGGLWNAKKMHDRARKAGLACWLGTMPELGIASSQALAIATLPGFVYPTDIEESSRWFSDDIIIPPITISKDGFIEQTHSGGTNKSLANYRVDIHKLEEFTSEIVEFQN